jgi:hypothetical protein
MMLRPVALLSPLYSFQAILEEHDIPKLLITVMDSVNASDSGPMMNLMFRLLLADDTKRTESFVHQYIKVSANASVLEVPLQCCMGACALQQCVVSAGWGNAVPLSAEAPAGEQSFCSTREDAIDYQPAGPNRTCRQQDFEWEL